MSIRLIQYFLILFIFFNLTSCLVQKSNNKSENHLIHETSPYLLQHAHNPVDWYPWKNEALEKAISERKLMVVSIGYSSCHWCHVMEKESFSDTGVARIMNENFINIKVDREERPDVDNVYMVACQLSHPDGSCGWPLNAICTPEGKPVWVGTYLSKDDWKKILVSIQMTYNEDPNDIEKMARELERRMLTSSSLQASEAVDINTQIISTLTEQIIESCDPISGGRAGVLKFPMPSIWQYLLHYGNATKDQKSINMVLLTLNKIIRSGIYDQVDGGISRYSTDQEWKVPHFEKMLYDNAQFISLMAECYKFNKDSLLKEKLTESLHFLISQFKNPESAYFSAYDADSEHEEGKYYVWSKLELETILTDPISKKIFFDLYDIRESGNWEDGKNILHESIEINKLAKKYQKSQDKINEIIDSQLELLKTARQKKVKPHQDTKIITCWNALMVIGLCESYTALGDESLLKNAIQTGNFISKNLTLSNGKLTRTYSPKQSNINAFLDDYASVILAYIKLYEITFDEIWLDKANKLCQIAITDYSDESNVYFYYNSKNDDKLIVRKSEMEDNVIPSSNSMMADVLLQLGHYYYNQDYIERSKQMCASAIDNLATHAPTFYTNWLKVNLKHLSSPYEIAIVGDDSTEKNLAMQSHYLPQCIFLGGKTEGTLELLKDKLQSGQTMIYVCKNKVCKLPVNEINEALKLIH